jgi:hypothetical protein
MDPATGLRRCPFCETEIETGDASCGACGARLVGLSRYGGEKPSSDGRRGQRLAVNRRLHDADPVVVWWAGETTGNGRHRREGGVAADDPGLTFDPIKVGPDTCSGCESTAVFVVEGQAAVYSLEGCDDDWCYYENPQGIA